MSEASGLAADSRTPDKNLLDIGEIIFRVEFTAKHTSQRVSDKTAGEQVHLVRDVTTTKPVDRGAPFNNECYCVIFKSKSVI